jgi:hypothetical protein
VMFPRKRMFAVMLVGALLGVSGLAPARASAAHGRVIGPLPAQAATVSDRRRLRRRRSRVRMIVLRISVRVRRARTIRQERRTVRTRRPFRTSFARGPPRPL